MSDPVAYAAYAAYPMTMPRGARSSASVSSLPSTTPAGSPSASASNRLGVPGRKNASSPQNGWSFPSSPSPPNSSTSPARTSTYTRPGHTRSMSTSPPPALSPASPPYHYRRLSSASMPRLILPQSPPGIPQNLNYGASNAPSNSLQPADLALSRQTSMRSNQSTMPSVRSEDETAPPAGSKAEMEEVHPLQATIERLALKCQQHDLRFRSSKSSFEHRVFTEFPSLLGEVSKLDERAEAVTASIYATIKKVEPEVKEKLEELEEQAKLDVETMRDRTTPWREFMDSPPGSPALDEASPTTPDGSAYRGGFALVRTRSGDQRRITKIERIRTDAEGEADAVAISQIERWGEDIIHNISDQIIALKTQLHNEGYRRVIIMRVVVMFSGLALLFIVFIATRKGSSSPLLHQ